MTSMICIVNRASCVWHFSTPENMNHLGACGETAESQGHETSWASRPEAQMLHHCATGPAR